MRVILVALLAAATLSAQATPKKLLFLTHAALYKHTSLGPAEKAVTDLGKTGGFEVTTVEGYKQDPKQLDFAFLTPEYLNQFDGVMMMTNGNLPFTDAQKKSLVDFVRGGKALIGAHCASLTFYNYPEFGEMLGGYFNRNLPQGTIAVLKVEDSKHPATKMLGTSWPLVDEFYLFGSAPWDAARPDENIDVLFKNKIPMGFSRDKVHVLLSLDTERMDMTKQPNLKRGGDYPQAWTKEVGKGRTFYTSLGHRDDIWSSHPLYAYAHVPAGWGGDATAQIEAQIERFAPGFRDRILGRHVRGPREMHRHNPNYVGGDVVTGSNDPLQMVFRPRPALNPYSLRVPGVYICSAATPPGAGAHGMCGYNAANAALRAIGRDDGSASPVADRLAPRESATA